MSRLGQLTFERNDWAAPMYDRIYTYDRPQFSVAPNEFLVRITGDLPPDALWMWRWDRAATPSTSPERVGCHRVRPLDGGPRIGGERRGGGRAVGAHDGVDL